MPNCIKLSFQIQISIKNVVFTSITIITKLFTLCVRPKLELILKKTSTTFLIYKEISLV